MPDEQRAASAPDEAGAGIEADRVRKFLSLAFSRWRLADEAESRTRKESLDDLEFRIGDQWPADIRSQREIDGRPCLTMNRLPQFIRQVTNDQRQGRPAILVSPIGDGADVDTAKMLQGAVRHVEVNSDADIAYDTAFESCVTGGFGYLRLVTEYADGHSFNQDIKIRRIKNPFTIYFDPTCAEADYSDARFAFVVEDLTAEEYKAQYPDSKIATLSLFTSTGNQPPGWLSKESVRVAEYFYVEEVRRRLLQLEDGFVMDENAYKQIRGESPLKPAVARFRDVLDRRVHWSKINALEIIEEREWPGQWIPVIPVFGDDIDVNGKRHIAGLIRHAKDPQRMYNYWTSASTEIIALAPKAPFVGAEGQFENHEAEWAQANVRNFAFLQYKPVSVGGNAVPAPQRQVYEPPIQAITLMTRQADNDIKGTMGLYDASLGERGPEQSGRAILARQRQGSMATFNFSDNMNRAIRFLGRQIVDLIPHIYDAPRILRIVNPDRSEAQVGVYNSRTSGIKSRGDAAAELKDPALDRIYDVGVGKYDVSISAGPSYQTKRQEAMESMTALVQSYPNLMGMVGDLLVRQMDWPFAQEIADRLKRALPPQLQDADETGADPKAQQARLQQQLQAITGQHDALTRELAAATETIRTRSMELESKERIAALQVQAQLVLAEAKIHGQAALELLSAQIRDIQARLESLDRASSVGAGEASSSSPGPPAGPETLPSPVPGGVQ